MRSETVQSRGRYRSSKTQRTVSEIRSLTRALSMDMNLRPDGSLIHVLGAGNERSNEEAMRTWTRNQLPEIGELARPQLLESLKSRLYRHLILWELER